MHDIQAEEKKIIETIRYNMNNFINTYGLKCEDICNFMNKKGYCSINRITLSKILGGNIQKINFAFLVAFCKTYQITLDGITSEDFNPDDYFEVMRKFSVDKTEDINKSKTVYINYPINEIFISNPKSPLLKKYIQTYYCYYYSTVATENNTGNIKDSLISGILKIEENGNRCTATLKIDTKTLDDNGKLQYKEYSGDVILCPSIQSIHCILTLPKGEFCFIIFRYSHLNFNKQECRIAEVLSTSSTPDKRYPIVHRMLLSNQKIEEKDLHIIASHLCFNSTDILISKDNLLNLAEEFSCYEPIVKEILNEKSELMYCIEEPYVKLIYEKYLNKQESPEFISRLRAYSYVKRYNKVSKSADECIRNILLKEGYYQKKPQENSH